MRQDHIIKIDQEYFIEFKGLNLQKKKLVIPFVEHSFIKHLRKIMLLDEAEANFVFKGFNLGKNLRISE